MLIKVTPKNKFNRVEVIFTTTDIVCKTIIKVEDYLEYSETDILDIVLDITPENTISTEVTFYNCDTALSHYKYKDPSIFLIEEGDLLC